MRTKNTDLKDVWRTPEEILSMIGDIDLDPCAGKSYGYQENGNTIFQEATDIAETNFTENGTVLEWFGRVFVNPPFSKKTEFLRKAVEEQEYNNTEYIIFLSPDSTDTKSWWHSYIAKYANYIWFSRGRINYISPVGYDPNPLECCDTNSVTFGTALSIFGEPPKDILRELAENGQLVQSVKEI